MDRRIQRTRKLIIKSFMDLLREKGFEKITVNDIADRADINRGTVYLHFLDKYDIFEKCIDMYIEELLSQCSDNEEIHLQEEAMRNVFSYLEEHIDLYKLLHDDDKYGIFRKKFTNALLGQVEIAMAVMPEEIATSYEIASQFLVNGFLGVIEWWIGNDMPCSAEEAMEKMLAFLKLILGGGKSGNNYNNTTIEKPIDIVGN